MYFVLSFTWLLVLQLAELSLHRHHPLLGLRGVHRPLGCRYIDIKIHSFYVLFI